MKALNGLCCPICPSCYIRPHPLDPSCDQLRDLQPRQLLNCGTTFHWSDRSLQTISSPWHHLKCWLNHFNHSLLSDRTIGLFKRTELWSCWRLKCSINKAATVLHYVFCVGSHHVEVQSVDPDAGVVLDAQIDVLLDAEAEVSRVGEVVLPQLVLAHLKESEII